MKVIFSAILFSLIAAAAYVRPVFDASEQSLIQSHDERFELVYHFPVLGEMLWTYQYGAIEQLARGGNPLAMKRIYDVATLSNLSGRQNRAFQQLAESETATAQLILTRIATEPIVDPVDVDRDYLLLTARAWKENTIRWHWTRVPNHEKERIIHQRKTYLSQLYAAAKRGDRDARWIVARL